MVTGLMVGCGALAGWTAVTGEVRASEMAVLLVWMFAWEIGGRNLVNDFADVEEDVRLGIKSVAVVHGPRLASRLTLVFLTVTTASALVLSASAGLGLPYSRLRPLGESTCSYCRASDCGNARRRKRPWPFSTRPASIRL
ncbi:MAG: UbiA family prenyltransferase [Dehalococcoidia bacterium]|nr:UbiA family prenyltransferase [Dehalococcoidia bacterium]